MNSSRNPDVFQVALDGDRAVTAQHYAAAAPPAGATLIVAHGAGAGQLSPFIVSFARAMSARGFDTVTFNFPYTEQKRRLPDRAPVLEACYAAVVRAVHDRIESARSWLFIGGKSMGGRMATQIAAADPGLPVNGLVLLGYPLHPPGKPQQRRDAHLPSVNRPMLFIQGSRDTFGAPGELRPILATLPVPATLHPIEGGDHSFKVSRVAAKQAVVDEDVFRTTTEWMQTIMGAGPTTPRTRG